LIDRGDHASALIDENPALVAGFFNCSRAAFVFAAEALAHGNPLKAAAEPPARTSFRREMPLTPSGMKVSSVELQLRLTNQFVTDRARSLREQENDAGSGAKSREAVSRGRRIVGAAPTARPRFYP
jgi:hypothetical protein